jgi:hypothetical protein
MPENARQLLQCGLYAEAYILLEQAIRKAPQDASVHFNMGLCLLFVGQAERAVQVLDQGLDILSAGVLPREAVGEPGIVDALAKAQANNGSYTAPMHGFETKQFPRRCRERFLRLIVNACVLTGDRERIERIADMLQSKHYHNVEEAQLMVLEE